MFKILNTCSIFINIIRKFPHFFSCFLKKNCSPPETTEVTCAQCAASFIRTQKKEHLYKFFDATELDETTEATCTRCCAAPFICSLRRRRRKSVPSSFMHHSLTGLEVQLQVMATTC